MARFSSLYSSSKGNCIFIGCSGGSVLIDAGVSAKKIEEALSDIDEDIKNIRAIFVTHEHSDHVKGLNAFASKHNIKVYASSGTLSALSESGNFGKINMFDIGCGCICEAGMKITHFKTTHDCREGVGYVFETPDGRRLAVATDLGYYSDCIKNAITGCDLVYIESNFDNNMLKIGPYPYVLKQRIASMRGHLSNDECSNAVKQLMTDGSTRFVLGHLSAENNLPSLAYEASLSSLTGCGGVLNKDFTLSVAPKLSPLEKIIF